MSLPPCGVPKPLTETGINTPSSKYEVKEGAEAGQLWGTLVER